MPSNLKLTERPDSWKMHLAMNDLVKIFGKLIGNQVDHNPRRAMSLLQAGFKAYRMKAAYFPDCKLPESSKFAAKASMNLMLDALENPQEAVLVNLFFPCEFLFVLGLKPIFIEGLAGFVNGARAENSFIHASHLLDIPKSFCSYHKIALGMIGSGVLKKNKLILNTTMACDANHMTFKMIEQQWQIPRFVLDLTGPDSPGALEMVETQLRQLAAFLEQETEQKIDEQQLQEIIRRENNINRYYRKTLALLKERRFLNTLGDEMFRLFFSHVYKGTPESELYFKKLYHDVLKSPAAPPDTKRLFWVHSNPFWQESINLLLNHHPDIQLICSDLNIDMLDDLDEDNPYRGIAQRLLNNKAAHGIRRRIDYALQVALLLDCHGVIYFNHWGCKITMGGSALAKKIFEENGLATLILDGDGIDRDNINDGQMRTKCQAFLEMIRRSRR